jgi:hypothetical protein
MKLSALYSVFNGTELLGKSIKQILPHVDTVIVCYQTVSNTGEHDIQVFDKCVKSILAENIPINRVIFSPFVANLGVNTKQNERDKHNKMLNLARLSGATHFFMSACDHFYDDKSIIYAKKYIENTKTEVTFTQMYTYFKHPTWQLTPMETYLMPFICELKPETYFGRRNPIGAHVDPALYIINANTAHIFASSDAVMHHYSMLRTDIRNKFKSAASSIRWTPEQVKTFIDEFENYDIKLNPGITYFQGRSIKTVPDYFNLSALTY